MWKETVDLAHQLCRHEGDRSKPYLDCCGEYWRDCLCTMKGKLTIGIGRNLDDVGITKEETSILLFNDIKKADAQVLEALPWTINMDRIRYSVLVNMAFNMGINGLLTFNKMLLFAEQGKYKDASVELLDSKFAKQVKGRANELSKQLETGEYIP